MKVFSWIMGLLLFLLACFMCIVAREAHLVAFPAASLLFISLICIPPVRDRLPLLKTKKTIVVSLFFAVMLAVIPFFIPDHPKYKIADDEQVASNQCYLAAMSKGDEGGIRLDAYLTSVQYPMIAAASHDPKAEIMSIAGDMVSKAVETHREEISKAADNVLDQCGHKFPAVLNLSVNLPVEDSNARFACQNIVGTSAELAKSGAVDLKDTKRASDLKQVGDRLFGDTFKSGISSADFRQGYENGRLTMIELIQKSNFPRIVDACVKRFPAPPDNGR